MPKPKEWSSKPGMYSVDPNDGDLEWFSLKLVS